MQYEINIRGGSSEFGATGPLNPTNTELSVEADSFEGAMRTAMRTASMKWVAFMGVRCKTPDEGKLHTYAGIRVEADGTITHSESTDRPFRPPILFTKDDLN